MKKLVSLVLVLLLIAAIPAIAEGGDVNGDGKIVVGYIAKNLTDPFHAPINSTAQEVIDGLVADGTITEWTGILDGNTDGPRQCDLAQDCINQGCDYVIILPCEAVASAPGVKAMADAGIKVVVVNSKTDNTDDLALCYCGSDDVFAGELMAKYVSEKCPDGGKYLHLQGVIGNSAQIQRGEGILNIIGADEKWECVADVPCDWAADKATNAAQDYLAQFGDELVAIIADNDDMSSAAQRYCNGAGRPDMVCIGVDGNQGPLQMVKNGELGATVLQDGVGQIMAGINAIIADIKGEEVLKLYDVPFVLVTAENVDQYLQ